MVGFLEVEEIERTYLRCRDYTRRHAKSFYFASHILPVEKRKAAFAIYAFCRYADNIVDDSALVPDDARARKRLDELRDQLRRVYSHSPSMDPKLLAFRDTVLKYGIPQEYFLDLLRGVEMDLTKRTYATFAELREYCYCVASVVGLMMTRIFGATDPVEGVQFIPVAHRYEFVMEQRPECFTEFGDIVRFPGPPGNAEIVATLERKLTELLDSMQCALAERDHTRFVSVLAGRTSVNVRYDRALLRSDGR